jgi:hypothetical protein
LVAGQSPGRQASAARGALHRRRPASRRPIAGQVEPTQLGPLFRTERVETGCDREGSPRLFQDSALQQPGFTGVGEETLQLRQSGF